VEESVKAQLRKARRHITQGMKQVIAGRMIMANVLSGDPLSDAISTRVLDQAFQAVSTDDFVADDFAPLLRPAQAVCSKGSQPTGSEGSECSETPAVRSSRSSSGELSGALATVEVQRRCWLEALKKYYGQSRSPSVRAWVGDDFPAAAGPGPGAPDAAGLGAGAVCKFPPTCPICLRRQGTRWDGAPRSGTKVHICVEVPLAIYPDDDPSDPAEPEERPGSKTATLVANLLTLVAQHIPKHISRAHRPRQH